ncbi:MAG: hybrid sensor histidine kinase/response regulator [Acidobacteria bacterium]|nr:MAG: hybrid sensor histidine kinase/response regulator [Acidobacteriota bacterium]REK11333.1 MAG: hybrid sensor histidine kinase/response regulator [Acidobacteriota bacterium]
MSPPQATPTAARPVSDDRVAGPVRALLVEDNPADARRVEILARRGLDDIAWRVCRSLAEALRVADEQAVELVLLDLNLPDSRGLDTLRGWFAGARGDRPVVVLSGHGELELARSAIREGATDYLPKDSLTSDLLARAVRYALARSEYESALREADERVRRSEKLEAIGQLAGGVAHDFNNVLGIILGNVELAATADRDELGELLAEIREAGQRAQRLTGQLLAVARKKTVERPPAIDLAAALRGSASLLRQALGDGVELDLRVDGAVAPVSIDRSQLEQVLLNLAVNSRDAMPRGGTFRVEFRRARPGALERGDGSRTAEAVRLVASDDGSGIAEDLLPRIFEPFVTSKAPGHGTGMGLATVYGIVRQAGGTVEVASRPGEGTRFEILLPLELETGAAPGASAEGEPAQGMATARGDETILLVDDEEPLRRLVERILGDLGYRVIAAPDPIQALEMLDAGDVRVDLLISDVVMPEMDGRTLAARARRRRPGLPVVFTSGYVPGVHLREDEGPGTRFLQKPVSRRTLAAAARAALDGRRADPPTAESR